MKRFVILIVALLLGGGVAVLGYKQIRPNDLLPTAKNPEEFKKTLSSLNETQSIPFHSPRAQMDPAMLDTDKNTRAMQIEERRKQVAEQNKIGLKSIVDKLANAPDLVVPSKKNPAEVSNPEDPQK